MKQMKKMKVEYEEEEDSDDEDEDEEIFFPTSCSKTKRGKEL